MNIGLVTTWFERGAAYVSRAYRDALAQQHQVFVYARGGESYARGDPRWDVERVTWGRRRQYGLPNAINWRDLCRWARRNKLDVMVFNEQWDWASVVLARRHLSAVLGAYVDYYKGNTVRFFDLFDFLLCNTHRHYNVFKHHRGALFVPWGTDVGLYSGDYRPAHDDSLTFFLSAGMNPVRKGVPQALAAFAMLPGRHQFIIHTQRPLADFPEIADACRTDPRIKVIDKTVTAPGLYHLGDVYVYPTMLEGIGLTVVEALACGLPVITTDSPPMNEFVSHKRNGYLVPPFEYRGRSDGYYWATSHCRPEDILTGMQYYVNNIVRISEFKRVARESAVSRFDWRRNSAHLAERLGDLVSHHARTQKLASLEQEALANDEGVYPLRYRIAQAVRKKLVGDRLAFLDTFLYG